MRRGKLTSVAVLIAVLCIGFAAWAQRGRGRGRFGGGIGPPSDEFESVAPARDGEFHFLRLEYTDLPQFHRGYGFSSRMGQGSGWWLMDWPAAENHFTSGLERLVRLSCGDPRHVSLTDEHLFDYPWIYATQTGWWGLSQAEIARLREYLLRGGFLMTDDFWGPDPEQWEVFRGTMALVLPGQPITDIAPGDSVMHVLYDIEPKDLTFIPGSRHLRRGPNGSVQIYQPEGTEPAWRQIDDGKGHMVVAVNYNTDIGDAWEFADVPYYPEKMTSLAYRYGVNYVAYAMTH